RRNVAAKELLDELRDVLAEVRVQAVDVLRALTFRELLLRPGQICVETGVELPLRRGHDVDFDMRGSVPRTRPGGARSAPRGPRRRRTGRRARPAPDAPRARARPPGGSARS